MREIEKEMVVAIREVQEWHKDNTKVRLGSHNGNINVYLHDKHLATVVPGGDIYVNRKTVAKYPTKTTVSRLKALGVDARLLGRPGSAFGVNINGAPATSADVCHEPEAHIETKY